MTNKEQLLFQAARQILQDQCPKDKKYYLCKKYNGEDEEIRCMECWDNYLLAIINGEVDEWKSKIG